MDFDVVVVGAGLVGTCFARAARGVSLALVGQAPGGPAAQFNQNPRISTAQINQWLQNWCLVQNPTPTDTVPPRYRSVAGPFP